MTNDTDFVETYNKSFKESTYCNHPIQINLKTECLYFHISENHKCKNIFLIFFLSSSASKTLYSFE